MLFSRVNVGLVAGVWGVLLLGSCLRGLVGGLGKVDLWLVRLRAEGLFWKEMRAQGTVWCA